MGLMGIMYSVPGLGHTLAGVQYIVGNRWEASEALATANRSVAVVAGAAVGSLAGPAGMYGGAVAAGAVYDAGHSLITGRPQGVLSGVDDIVTSVENKDIGGGISSVLKTTVYVGADALTGLGGGTIVKNLPSAIGKDLVKDVAVVAVKSSSSVLCTGAGKIGKDIADSAKYRPPSSPGPSSSSSGTSSSKPTSSSSGSSTSNSTSSSSGNGTSTTSPNSSSKTGTSNTSKSSSKSNNSGNTNSSPTSTGNSGSQPPKDDKSKNTKKAHEIEQPQSLLFVKFFEIFYVKNLNEICINGVYIFREITSGKETDRARKNSLKTLLKMLMKNNSLEWVMKEVQSIMNTMHPSEVTFVNFLNLSELVARYSVERLAVREYEIQRGSEDQNASRELYEQRRQNYLDLVSGHILHPLVYDLIAAELFGYNNIVVYDIATILAQLTIDIGRFAYLTPNFVNQWAAVSHYFKHRVIPGTEEVLSVSSYMCLIISLMETVSGLDEYTELKEGKRQKLTFDRVYANFGFRRVRLVLKIQNGQIVISSCHILDDPIPGDEDGFEEIDADIRR